MRGVRQAVNRMRRAGYTCRVVRQRDLPATTTLRDAVQAADAFREGPVERGFSMALSRLGDPQDADCLLVLARDADGQLRGLLQFVPWGGDGLSLDLMRGDRTADNGLTELMVVMAWKRAASRRTPDVVELRRSPVGLRPRRRAGRRPGAAAVTSVAARASRFWQIESLYRANAKYQPAWQPRYLCFPTARDLPRIAVAVLSAEAFLPTVKLPARRRPSGVRA